MLHPNQPIAIYLEGYVGNPRGKTGYGVLRYSQNPIVCVVDSTQAGHTITERMGIPGDCPIVESIAEARKRGAEVLVLGVANSGGIIAESWRADIDDAIEVGMSVLNGLHERLEPAYRSRLKPGQWVWDVRAEPKDLTIGKGEAAQLSNKRVLFVGTDMAVGKMTAALELHRAAVARGTSAAFVATGQTGIAIAGHGVALDAIRLDFASGAIEREVLACRDADVVFIEGQGALCHPGSTATLPLIRGSMPTHLVVCHRLGQTALQTLPDVPIPDLRKYIEFLGDVCAVCGTFQRPAIVGVCLDTRSAPQDEEAQAAIRALSETLELPVTDPVRFGVGALLDKI